MVGVEEEGEEGKEEEDNMDDRHRNEVTVFHFGLTKATDFLPRLTFSPALIKK